MSVPGAPKHVQNGLGSKYGHPSTYLKALKAKICKYEAHILRIQSKNEIASLCFLHPASLCVCVREVREVLQPTKEVFSTRFGSRMVPAVTRAEVSTYPAVSVGEEVSDTPSSSSSSLIQE